MFSGKHFFIIAIRDIKGGDQVEGERTVTVWSLDIISQLWGIVVSVGGCLEAVTPFSQHESSDKIEKEKAAETSEYWKSESQESERLSHSDMSLFFFFYISVLWLFASLDASVHLIGRFVFVSPSDLFLSFNTIFSPSVRVYVCSVCSLFESVEEEVIHCKCMQV